MFNYARHSRSDGNAGSAHDGLFARRQSILQLQHTHKLLRTSHLALFRNVFGMCRIHNGNRALLCPHKALRLLPALHQRTNKAINSDSVDFVCGTDFCAGFRLRNLLRLSCQKVFSLSWRNWTSWYRLRFPVLSRRWVLRRKLLMLSNFLPFSRGCPQGTNLKGPLTVLCGTKSQQTWQDKGKNVYEDIQGGGGMEVQAFQTNWPAHPLWTALDI